MALLNWSNDRIAGKIAFCSAVVAGVAYVGYSIASNLAELTKHRNRKSNGNVKHRVFLRRLSQTTQTDALLGDLDFDNLSKIILRPKSVQERIKELNDRANQFAEAVIAIKKTGAPRPSGVSARSLQVSPWASPRVLSPVEILPIEHPRSTDPHCSNNTDNHSPMHLSLKTQCRDKNSMANSLNLEVNFDHTEDLRVRICDRMWNENREEIIEQLSGLLGNPRVLSLQESQFLVASLNCEDSALLSQILKTASGCAAFTASQNTLREAGLLVKISKLLLNLNNSLRDQVLIIVSNMALNERNNHEMRLITSILVHLIQTESSMDQSLVGKILNSLTNIAVLPTWHKEMRCILHKLFHLMDEFQWDNTGLSTLSLRLLINLSCNEEMVPYLLAAKAPARLIYMVDIAMPDTALLRVTTLMANIAASAKRLKINPTYDLPAEGKAPAPDTLYAAIFGLSAVERLERKAQILCERHLNEDVKMQACRLLESVAN